MAGLMEGYIKGLQFVSGLQEMQQRQDAFQLQQFQQRQAIQQNAQERGILSQVFQSRAAQVDTNDQLGANDRLASQYREAGRRLMGVNPKDAMGFLQESDRLQHQASQARLENARAEKLKGEYLASVMQGVTDQDSLDEAKQTFAKEGRTIPQRYQTWNEGTKAWLERQVHASIPISKQQDLALRTREFDLKGQAEQRRQADEERKTRNDESREARLREGLELKKRVAGAKASSELGLKGEDAVRGELSILKAMEGGDVLGKAPPGLQRQAAQDVHFRAQKLRADSIVAGEEPLSAEEALDQARRQVLGEMKEKEGGFMGMGKSAERVRGGVEKPDADVAKVKSLAMEAWGEFDLSKYDYRLSPEGKLQRRRKE